jgi:tetratricopeptide (TPR) repeat protein
MKGSRPWLLLAATVIVAGFVAFAGWRNYAARRAWKEMRPGLPEEVGASAPGLDTRLAACFGRLQTWPPDHAALAEFSQLCHANGMLEPAMSGYQALTILEPNEARWPHLLASILAGYGRLDEALPLLHRTTTIAPDHLVGWLRLGDALFKANATTDAEAAYQEALKRAPGNPYALLGLARCDLQLERWTAARSHLQQAVAGDPKFAGAQSLLASVFERLGNPEAAAVARARVANDGHYTDPPDSWTDELPAYCHNPYTLLIAASAATADGTPAKALPPLQRALMLAPNDPRIHRQKAKTLSNLGDVAGARVALEKAVELSPDDENMQLDLIALLRAAKDQDALKKTVTVAVAACPASAALHFEAGLLAVDAGQLQTAEEHFRFTWKNRPEQPEAARELAKIYFRTQRNAEGVAVLEKLLALESHDVATHVLLVQHGLETGDQRTAAWLQRAQSTGMQDQQLIELQQNFRRRSGREIR